MKSLLIFLAFYISILPAVGQISDDFSDGELLNNPTWRGDLDKFIVTTQGQLQLDAAEAGVASIFTELGSTDLFSWQLDIKMDFAPSASNRLRIYLWADGDNLSVVTGYFIQLGETGSDDRLRLFKVQNGNEIELAQGTFSFNNRPFFTLRVTLKGSELLIESRKNGEQIFRDELTHADADQLIRNSDDLFVIVPTFTSTRLDKFTFDNISVVKEHVGDTSAPIIRDIQVLGLSSLRASFTEDIDSSSATNVDNYVLEPDGWQPISAHLSSDKATVELTFGMPLHANENYILVASNIEDLNGNKSTSQWEFTFQIPESLQPFDLVINEIYDDPTPTFGLPSAEYIELFVQTRDSLNLGQLSIQNFAKGTQLPPIMVPSNSHIILCNPSDASTFTQYGLVIPIEAFPSLLNGGNELALQTMEGEIIHKIAYNDSWYGDNSKDNGGWSLELINPKNACALQDNWAASKSLIGGTPGQPNSVLDFQHRTSELEIYGIVPVRSDRVIVNFNKALNQVSTPNFHLVGGVSKIQSALITGPNLQQVALTIDPPLEADILYQLEVSDISDCTSTAFESVILDVQVPEPPLVGDIVINEILFNPEVGGVDFIEIFNASGKSFQIADLAFANNNDQSQQLRPILTQAILLPGTYFVFTPDPSDIRLRYPPVNSKAIFRNPIPTLPDQSGSLSLVYQGQGIPRIVDSVDYDEGFHSKILRDHEGVSIERIDPQRDSQDPSNWHSAASIVGHATPTQPNSQFRALGENNKQFSLDPARLSPDGDGFEDFLTIDYQLPGSGYISHVRIFDAAGRLTRYLLNNESLSTKGQIKWDGESDDGLKSPVGIYTILIEAFNQNGDSIKQQEVCVLAGKLN